MKVCPPNALQQHGSNFHISLTVQGRPAALSPPLSFGLVYTTVPGVLHCCWFLHVPAQTHQGAHGTLCHDAAGCPVLCFHFWSALHTRYKAQLPHRSQRYICTLVSAPALPKFTSRAHKAALSAEGRNISPFLLWGAAHTVLCCQTALASLAPPCLQ